MRAALPSLPDKKEQPLQDPGERQGTTPPPAAKASGLPSAATASALAAAAPAIDVENMKFEDIPLHIPGETSDEDESVDEWPTLHYTKDGHVVNAEGHPGF